MNRIICVECWADYYFFAKLLNNEGLIRKEKNKNEVLKALKERIKDSFAIGIIDKDKKDLNDHIGKIEFDIVYSSENLELYKSKFFPHYVFQLCPNEFENWINDYLILKEKDISDFGYNGIIDFCKDSKTIKPTANKRFLDVMNFVFDQLKNDEEENFLKKLKKQLQLLVNKNYHVDLNELKNV